MSPNVYPYIPPMYPLVSVYNPEIWLFQNWNLNWHLPSQITDLHFFIVSSLRFLNYFILLGLKLSLDSFLGPHFPNSLSTIKMSCKLKELCIDAKDDLYRSLYRSFFLTLNSLLTSNPQPYLSLHVCSYFCTHHHQYLM